MKSKTYYLTPSLIKAKAEGEDQILDGVLGKFDILLELSEHFTYLAEEKEPIDFELKRKLVRFLDVQLNEAERMLYGILEYGEYGEEKAIVDKTIGKETYDISKDEAPMEPYYFCFWIPNDSTKGVLLTQKTSNKGIITVFHDIIREIFTSYPFAIYINPLILKRVLDKLFSNPIKRLKFITYSTPKDVAERFKVDWKETYKEIHFVAKKNKAVSPSWIEPLREKLLDGDKINFAELISEENDSDEVDIVFRLSGNRQRTLKIKKFVSLKTDYLLENLEFGDNGHPTLDSLHKEALYLLDVIKGTAFGIEE